MLTRDQLAERLKEVDTQAVATLAGVSTKTIYRLRAKTHAPSFGTAERLLAALKMLRPKRGERA